MPDKRTYADRRDYMLAYAKRPEQVQKKHEYINAYLAARPMQRKGHKLRERYGMSLDDYRDMLVGQAGRCLICLRVPKTDLEVDHDHATGEVRGLLCGSCNRALGLLKDDTVRMANAIRYLGGD